MPTLCRESKHPRVESSPLSHSSPQQGSARLSVCLSVRAWSLRTGKRHIQWCKARADTQAHLAQRLATLTALLGRRPVQVTRPLGSVSERPCSRAQSLLEDTRVVWLVWEPSTLLPT